MTRRQKGRSQKGGGLPTAQPYDTEMIREFLDQLMWELRTAAFEVGSAPGTLNADLLQQLAPYLRRRGSALLAINELDPAGVTKEEAEKAVSVLRRRLTASWQAAIELLEALAPIFEEALTAASRPWSRTPDGKGHAALVRRWPARELLASAPPDSED